MEPLLIVFIILLIVIGLSLFFTLFQSDCGFQRWLQGKGRYLYFSWNEITSCPPHALLYLLLKPKKQVWRFRLTSWKLTSLRAVRLIELSTL